MSHQTPTHRQPLRPGYISTSDALGVCQARTNPCANCKPAIHLHRVHPICSADQCHQGSTTCPFPQTCEVPGTGSPQTQPDEPSATHPLASFAVFGLAVLLVFLAFAIVVILTASA